MLSLNRPSMVLVPQREEVTFKKKCCIMGCLEMTYIGASTKTGGSWLGCEAFWCSSQSVLLQLLHSSHDAHWPKKSFFPYIQKERLY